MACSSPGWWDANGWDGRVRVDLAEIMDDLDPGWSRWREPEGAPVGLG